MLVVSRRRNESIMIKDDIEVKIIEVAVVAPFFNFIGAVAIHNVFVCKIVAVNALSHFGIIAIVAVARYVAHKHNSLRSIIGWCASGAFLALLFSPLRLAAPIFGIMLFALGRRLLVLVVLFLILPAFVAVVLLLFCSIVWRPLLPLLLGMCSFGGRWLLRRLCCFRRMIFLILHQRGRPRRLGLLFLGGGSSSCCGRPALLRGSERRRER